MFESETSHFSFFDFLGYLLPGLLCLLMIEWVSLLWNVKFVGLRDWISLLLINSPKENSWLLESLWIVVLAYLLGHIVSFLASMTVEVFSHQMYKYPSDFLLMRLRNLDEEKQKKKQRKNEKGLSSPCFLDAVSRIILFFLLLPISFWAYVLGRWCRFEYYYLKPLDEVYAWNINCRFRALNRKLKLKMGLGEKYELEEFGDKRVRQVYNTDFHRIAYNYEYEKTKQHQNKLDSYIALYGFMRAVSFLSVMLFWLFVIILTKQSLWCAEAWAFMAVYFPFPYVLFMAFMKFYRRHTLETFMCLLVDEELVAIDITKPLEIKQEGQANEEGQYIEPNLKDAECNKDSSHSCICGFLSKLIKRSKEKPNKDIMEE